MHHLYCTYKGSIRIINTEGFYYICQHSVYICVGRVGEGGVRGFSDQSGWIFMEAANTLFTVSSSVAMETLSTGYL